MAVTSPKYVQTMANSVDRALRRKLPRNSVFPIDPQPATADSRELIPLLLIVVELCGLHDDLS
jgi:hypothetical protein